MRRYVGFYLSNYLVVQYGNVEEEVALKLTFHAEETQSQLLEDSHNKVNLP